MVPFEHKQFWCTTVQCKLLFTLIFYPTFFSGRKSELSPKCVLLISIAFTKSNKNIIKNKNGNSSKSSRTNSNSNNHISHLLWAFLVLEVFLSDFCEVFHLILTTHGVSCQRELPLLFIYAYLNSTHFLSLLLDCFLHEAPLHSSLL